MTRNFRVLGNFGIVVGQLILLFGSRQVGLTILISSSASSLPYFIRHKYYDVVLLIVVSMVINTAGLFLGRTQ